MPSHSVRGSLRRGFTVLTSPGMYLVQKYTQYKRTHHENQRKKATEKELQCLHLKIDKLLSDLDENDSATLCSEDEEVVCRKCFVKTIQVAVSQRCLPLLCVVCRTKIYRLKQSGDSPPLTPPPSRQHLQLPWQCNRSRSPPGRRSHSGRVQRSSSLARQLFGGGGRASEVNPASNPTNIDHKSLTSASKTGSNQSKPVATKLMKPLLIYPSDSVLAQQHGYALPTALRRNNVTTGDQKKCKKQVRFASPIRMHSPIRLMCPSTRDNMQSTSPKQELPSSLEKRLSSIKYADCFSPRLARSRPSPVGQRSPCIKESFMCPPYNSLSKGMSFVE